MTLNVTSLLTPQHMELLETIETGGRCYDVEFYKGYLYVANHDGIRIYPQYGNSYKTISPPNNNHINSAQNVSGKPHSLYAIQSGVDRNSKVVYELNVGPSGIAQNIIELFSYPEDRNYARFISGTNSMIAATSKNKLIIFDIKTKMQKAIMLDCIPSSLLFISDELVLVTGGTNMLLMLRLRQVEEVIEHETVWTSTAISGPYGVCTTEKGLVVLRSNKQPTVHILSPLGKIIHCERMYDTFVSPLGNIPVYS